MSDEPSQRAEARARTKARRTKGFGRREAIFDLFLSGFSHQQIAKALGTSAAAVRRIIDRAVAGRRLDAPDRHVRVQVARLMKALSHADFKLEKGDVRAFGPYLRIIAELDRYHGLAPADWRVRVLRTFGRRDAAPPNGEDVLPAPPPLALTHAAPPLDLDSEPDVAASGVQPIEIAHDGTDSEPPEAAKVADFGA
ncbi:MAG TPA: helix-turn-helix domain-containing protein [Roseiarcus sp.]|jgi:hypothetical protein|nr:helix-turn-helix domain-containing protein [Roseiarcus sp.]